jgi:hypothetical protein
MRCGGGRARECCPCYNTAEITSPYPRSKGSTLRGPLIHTLKAPLRILRRGQRLEIQSRMATAFSRAAATAAAREPDPARPLTWEFSGFSQHGEDGIVDYLCDKMVGRNRYFVEIGAADGLQNCSAWLAFARRFAGVMIEGNPDLTRYCLQVLREAKCHNVATVNQLVAEDNVAALMKYCPYRDPDVFIIDIDGIDFYVMQAVLELELRPKLVVVEYNSVFGPERSVTVPYDERFSRQEAHPSMLYYGVSIAAWRNLLEKYGYAFVTVESNGTNAFFVHRDAFPEGFVGSLHGIDFLDNASDKNGGTALRRDDRGDWTVPARDWQRQFEMIEDLPLVTVTRGA